MDNIQATQAPQAHRNGIAGLRHKALVELGMIQCPDAIWQSAEVDESLIRQETIAVCHDSIVSTDNDYIANVDAGHVLRCSRDGVVWYEAMLAKRLYASRRGRRWFDVSKNLISFKSLITK